MTNLNPTLITTLLAVACLLTQPLTSLSSTELANILDLSMPGTANQIMYNADANDARVSGSQLAQSAAIGDVNGDGINDLLIGVPAAQGPDNRRQSAGEVLIFFGRAGPGGGTIIRDAAMPSPPTGSGADVIIYGPVVGLLGISVAAADLNGDGIDDIIAGALGATKRDPGGGRPVPSAGAVFVVFGSTELASGTRLDLAAEDEAGAGLRVFGAHLASLAGQAVAAGDVNGDAIADLIIGAPGTNKGGSARAFGAAYVVFGGAALAGFRDLGATPSSGRGADVVVFGADAAGRTSGDQLGVGVASGDVNGDHIDDLIVSAPLADGPANQRRDAGEVYVFFGGPGLTSGTAVDLAQTSASVRIHGAAQDDQLGFSLGTGDLNGDGTSDLLMGATGRDSAAGEDAGAVYVVFGGRTLTSGLSRDLNQAAPPSANGADVLISGPGRRSSFGISLASGDVNGDRVADLVVGAEQATNRAGVATGLMYVFYGSAALTSGRVLDAAAPAPPQGNGAHVVILGVNEGDMLGFDVAAGDVNDDGIADLLMAAPGGDGPNDGRPGAGETYLVLGER